MTRVWGEVTGLPEKARAELHFTFGTGGAKVPREVAKGKARFSVQLPGPTPYEVTLHLEDETPLGRRRRQRLGWLSVGEGVAEQKVRWEVSPLVVRGRVVGLEGEAVMGARVVITEQVGECADVVPGRYHCDAETDAEGRLTCPAVPPRPLVLPAAHPTGFAYREKLAPPAAGELTLRLEPGAPLEGKVLGKAGGSAYSAALEFYPDGFRLPFATMSQAGGSFRFPAVPQEGGVVICHVVNSEPAHELGDTVVEVAKGQWFVAVEPAPAAAAVVRWSREAQAGGLRLVALEPQGLPLWSRAFMYELPSHPSAPFPARTSTDFSGLAAGRWRAVALDEECRPLAFSRPVRIG